MARLSAVLLAIAALLVAFCQASSVVLNAENFESEVTKGTWLVKFYAPWCGHCKRLAPTWERLADEAQKRDINIGKVDCNDNEAHYSNVGLCMRFLVNGYPTVKLIREGQVYEYDGGRNVNDFIEFAETGYTGAVPSSYPSSWVAIAVAQNVLDQLAFAFRGFGEDIARHVFLSLTVAVLLAWSVGCVCGRMTAPSWKPNPPLDAVATNASSNTTTSSTGATASTPSKAKETKKEK